MVRNLRTVWLKYGIRVAEGCGDQACSAVWTANWTHQPVTLYLGMTVGEVHAVQSTDQVFVDVHDTLLHGTVMTLNPEKLKAIEKTLAAVVGATTQDIDEQINQIKLSHAELSPDMVERFKNMLWRNKEVFAKNPRSPVPAKVPPCSINTEGSRPHKLSPYRVSKPEEKYQQAVIEEMRTNGIIEESCSPWAHPVVVVSKKDGTLRFCVDYRKLNAVTKKDTYPLPRIDDMLDSLGEAKFFSTMDLASGYWQIPLDNDSKEKTAFVTKQGLYQFQVMPFGLTNAPAIFQRTMDVVLAGIKWQYAMVYIDDIIVYSKTFGEHIRHLEDVFGRLAAANLTLKLSKCNFLCEEVQFLGHVISAAGVRTPIQSKW